MKILMVSAEYAPLAKTGGLADAVAGLAAALAQRGHDVRTVMPRYGGPLPAGFEVEPHGHLDGGQYALARPSGGSGPPIYLVESDAIAHDGRIYTLDDRDAGRFWAFSRAALAFASRPDWRADLLHCHDWHAALVPPLARSTPVAATPSVLTVHNAGYQGRFPRHALPGEAHVSLEALASPTPADADHANFLALGIAHADTVTTVSPGYARELCTAELGMGLDELLRARGGDFVGILNGVDYSLWSPESDPFISRRFARDDSSGKQQLKADLSAELGLASDAPLVGAVTRLVEQKGIDLLVGALPILLERTRASFAILGSGEPQLESALTALADTHRGRLVFRNGYDEPLAHRIIGGSDLLVVPSRYEPCGLTQLYAMRYGTVPVVRKTGGLADTVSHYDPATGDGTGSVFEHADVTGLVWGLTTALGWYDDKRAWRRLVANALAADFSWERQSGEYEALYRELLAARR